MKIQPSESTTFINKRQINLKICSGVATGVQKYTKTHVSGGGDSAVSSWIETIIEFSIQQANGNEVQVTLREKEIQVRDKQCVSVIWGCSVGRRSDIIFVNHDNNKLYWIGKPHSFFERLGIFTYFSPREWAMYFIAIPFSIPMFVFVRGSADLLSLAIVGIVIGIAGIIFFIIQEYRVRSAWKIIEPLLTEMTTQLRY
jgi:hypothetical protein